MYDAHVDAVSGGGGENVEVEALCFLVALVTGGHELVLVGCSYSVGR